MVRIFPIIEKYSISVRESLEESEKVSFFIHWLKCFPIFRYILKNNFLIKSESLFDWRVWNWFVKLILKIRSFIVLINGLSIFLL